MYEFKTIGKMLLISTALGGLTIPTSAADMPESSPAMNSDYTGSYSSAYNWTGFYVGAHAGGGWGDKAWHGVNGAGGGQGGSGNSLNAAQYDTDGFLGGIQAGYNLQHYNFVIGIEGEISYVDIDGSGLGGIGSSDRPFSSEVNWIGSLTTRVGYAHERILAYVETGIAVVNEDHSHTRGNGDVMTGDDTRGGWLVGAGLEYALNDKWTIKSEYNYMQFNGQDLAISGDGSNAYFAIDQDMHIVKVGANYRIGEMRQHEEMMYHNGDIYDWTGFYAGVHIGGGTGDKDWHGINGAAGGQGGPGDSRNAANYDTDGMLGGIQVGYNVQHGHLVMGVEADVSMSGIDGDGLGGVNSSDRPFSSDINWLATATGRVGYAHEQILAYVEAGIALIDEEHSHTTGNGTTPANDVLKGDDTRGGWVVGAGLEYAFADSWSLKGEYNYMQFNGNDVRISSSNNNAAFEIEQDMHAFKLGLNYQF